MGTIVCATGFCDDPTFKSLIKLTASAARNCLDDAGVRSSSVGLLLNVGVYRDKNIVEPSMAAMIQSELGINPDYVEHPVTSAAFSFDLTNGSCGAVNAIQVSDAVLRCGRTEYVLLVGADVHPSGETSQDFPYASVGTAMLLTHDPSTDRGFVGFKCAHTDSGTQGVRGYVDLNDRGPQMRRRITVERDENYEAGLLDLSVGAAKQLMRETRVHGEDAILVASEPREGFAAALAAGLGFSRASTFSSRPLYGDTHSSSVLLAAHLAGIGRHTNAVSSAVWIAVGSGLSCAAATYRLS